MNSEDEHITSDIFDIPDSAETQIFAFKSDHLKPSSSHHNLCDHYLHENIGEPLNRALAYVIIHRPEDAIEFIANFLIDWSRQKLIAQERNSMLTQSFLHEEHKKEAKRLLNGRKEEKQDQEIVFEHDKRLLSSYQENSHINPPTDDEGELSNHFQNQKQQTHRTNTQQYIHTHDTSSGLDDEMKSNQENNRNHPCHDGNLSSFTYFSQLSDKIINCDES